ncbi:MAG: phosphoribosylanthranilate isomerase [Vicinamibacterales bacterium]
MIAKICGITRPADALHAVRHGATALGFVFWPHSPRYVSPGRAADIIRALPGTVTAVGVFVNQPIDEIGRIATASGITTIQLHGDEPPAYAAAIGRAVWRAVSLVDVNGTVSEWPAETTILVDAHDPARRGGTGRAVDWDKAASIACRRRIVLAGGLTPDNVQQAIAAVRPFGVDVSSGVEEAPGVKDLDKVARFLERALAAFDGR